MEGIQGLCENVNKDAVLVGEVWQSDSGVIAEYYKSLDSCSFH